MSTTTYFAYDNSRRLTTQYPLGATGESRYYSYNQRNLITKIQDVVTSGPQDATASFTYNGVGERVLVQDFIDGHPPSYFTYDKTKLLTEKDSSGATVGRYRHNEGVLDSVGSALEAVISYTGIGNSTFNMALDHTGSVRYHLQDETNYISLLYDFFGRQAIQPFGIFHGSAQNGSRLQLATGAGTQIIETNNLEFYIGLLGSLYIPAKGILARGGRMAWGVLAGLIEGGNPLGAGLPPAFLPTLKYDISDILGLIEAFEALIHDNDAGAATGRLRELELYGGRPTGKHKNGTACKCQRLYIHTSPTPRGATIWAAALDIPQSTAFDTGNTDANGNAILDTKSLGPNDAPDVFAFNYEAYATIVGNSRRCTPHQDLILGVILSTDKVGSTQIQTKGIFNPLWGPDDPKGPHQTSGADFVAWVDGPGIWREPTTDYTKPQHVHCDFKAWVTDDDGTVNPNCVRRFSVNGDRASSTPTPVTPRISMTMY